MGWVVLLHFHFAAFFSGVFGCASGGSSVFKIAKSHLFENYKIADEMLAGGLQAFITCVDPRAVPASFAGRAFDRALLAALPPGVDPCGENGEFLTFAWDGPMFRYPVPVRVGEVVARGGFVFADLLPSSGTRDEAAATA